ncbi:hypothetical protein BHM03_00022587 [Ensete ventricosum]|nr:hypothetical protein BHM03_00022587 [Ensete ventricosum]
MILVPYVKVRTETSPEDVGGMHSAEGILTARGGMTSHAAVVARGWGKCCVSGCSDIHVNDAAKVMANADTPDDALAAINNGAQGIGLCRTEHMVRLPVTIRLLDPPLHEFLPEGNLEDIVGELASEIGIKEEEILTRVEKLSEVNPMLGFRGCR